MKQITITLHDEMYAELEDVSAGCRELGFSPAKWAQEAVEAVLATRRLPRMWTAGGYGGHHNVAKSESEIEPEPYPVHLEQML